MKKILRYLLVVLIFSFGAFIVTACDFGGNDGHEHAWGEWTTVTSPDCYNKGLERRVCTLDSTHVDERETPEQHNGNLFCKDCYRPIVQEISSEYYVNLATTAINTPLAFVVNNVTVTLTEQDYSLQYKITFAELSIYFDQQNQLRGYGNGKTTQKQTIQGQEIEVYYEVRLVIEGKEVYLHAISTQEERIYDEYYKLGESALTQLLEQAFGGDVIKYYQDLITWFDQDGKTQIQNFLQTNKAFINSYLAFVTNGFLESTAKSFTYELSLNWQGLKDVNEYLYSKTFEQGLEEIFGSQPLSVIRQKIDELLEITVGELVNLVEQKTGNTMESTIDALWVYFDLPDTIKGVSKEYIKQNICGNAVANVTVGALLEDYINAGNDYNNRVSLQVTLDEIFADLEKIVDYTPYQALVMAVDGVEQAQANQGATLLYNAVNAFANEMQGVASLNLITDKDGNLMYAQYLCNVDVKEFVQNIEQAIGQEIDVDANQSLEISVEIKSDYIPQKDYDLTKGIINNKIKTVVNAVDLFNAQLTQLGVVCQPIPAYVIQTKYINGTKHYQAKVDLNSNDFITITFNENMQVVQANVSVYMFNGYETHSLEIPD